MIYLSCAKNSGVENILYELFDALSKKYRHLLFDSLSEIQVEYKNSPQMGVQPRKHPFSLTEKRNDWTPFCELFLFRTYLYKKNTVRTKK
jgi:hypothetical protein